MNKKLLFSLIGIFLSIAMYSQDVIGKWKTIDDNTGKERSAFDIYQGEDGKIYGRIIAITDPSKQNELCTQCKGSKKDQPIMGMVLLEGLTKDGDTYSGGTIVDPDNGKMYDCKIWREGDELKVRGYIGWFYRTQTWLKVE